MKIADVLNGMSAEDVLPPLQKQVLRELNKRKDEIFTYSDPEFPRVFPYATASAINWTFWALQKNGHIDKYKVKGQRKQHFGSKAAIKELKRRAEARES